VAIDESGNVLVVWSYFDGTAPAPPGDRDEGCCNAVRMTVRSASSGHFRRSQNLVPEGHDVRVGAIAIVAGRVAVAWAQASRIRARFAPRGRRLEAAGSVRGYGFAIGVAPSRRGARVTLQRLLNRGSEIREFQLGRRRVSTVRTLVTSLPPFADVAMATNARGDQVASWGTKSGWRYAAVRRHGGRFRARRVGRGSEFDYTSAAVSPDGRAGVVSWTTGGHIRIATRTGGGRFGAARSFAMPPRYASLITSAVDDAGRAVVAWSQLSADAPDRMVAALLSPRGRQLHRRQLDSSYVSGLTAAIDGRGRARVVWTDFSNVLAARASYPRRRR
jgi:hypothetical protein